MIADGVSKAGDYVLLRAEMPVIVVISNCPQQHNPAAGFSPTPVEVVVSQALEEGDETGLRGRAKVS